MTEGSSKAVFEAYFAAFAETSESRREELMRYSVDENVSFSNPGVVGQGVEKLLVHIALFQERFPGGRFRINWVKEQHSQILGEWTQLNGDGSELVTAHSYALLNEGGRISRFAGFWNAF